LGDAAVVHGVSFGELLGLNVAAAWTLFWTLFFVRLILGFAVGVDDVRLSLRRPTPPAATSPEARALRRGNNVVTMLNLALLFLFVLLTPWMRAP
jgi:hypothetical protein